MDRREPLIRIEGLLNRFGAQVVHEDLNLDIFANEILGIVGGSGSGKSVLVRTILGLNRPVAGHISLYGRDYGALAADDWLELKRHWGVLFQNGALFSGLTVRENVEVPMREHLRLPEGLCRELAELKIRLARLPLSAGDKFPAQLSGGMIKRASLARALALDPKTLFLDEPTAGLDPIAAAAFDSLVRHLQQTLSLTVVIITHDLDTLVGICDRIAVLVDRRAVTGSLDELMESPHPWIRDYFHGTRMHAATGRH